MLLTFEVFVPGFFDEDLETCISSFNSNKYKRGDPMIGITPLAPAIMLLQICPCYGTNGNPTTFLMLAFHRILGFIL